MKIDRAIMVLSDNPIYEGFWEYSSKFWSNKFGIKPTLFIYGDFKKIKIDYNAGEVYKLNYVADVSVNSERDWACTWGLFYGASQFANEVCMTCGIDQAPLSNKFLNDLEKYDYEDNYVVGFSDGYCDLNTRQKVYPSSHHVAKGKTYKRVYNIENVWENEVRKVFQHRNNYAGTNHDFWGLDEAHSSFLLQSEPNLIQHVSNFNTNYLPYRIDRGNNMSYNKELLKSGYYLEVHANRPFAQHKDVLEEIYNLTPTYK